MEQVHGTAGATIRGATPKILSPRCPKGPGRIECHCRGPKNNLCANPLDYTNQLVY